MEKYPKKVKDFIEKNHTGVGPKDMAELLNKIFGTSYTKMQMKSYYGNNKINSGLDGRFKPGHVPHNKGKKGISYEGMEATQFKKGNKPANWVPLGSERVNGDGYIDIKIADGKKQKNWKGKHIIIWEKHNGPVPKGHAIIFGDGDNRNFDINNLVLVSRQQLLILNRNNLIKNDADLTRTGIAIADLYQKISQRKANTK